MVRLRAADKSAIRERLLDEGVARLTETGFHGSGLQDILTAVQIPKGSFYNYFESKEAFGAAVVAHYIAPFIQRVRELTARPDLSPLAALELYFAEQIEELERRDFQGGCLLGNLLGEIGDTSPVCRSALCEALTTYRDQLAHALRRAQADRAIRNDLPAEVLADLLVNSWQGALLRMKVERSTAPLRACTDHLLRGYFQPQDPR